MKMPLFAFLGIALSSVFSFSDAFADVYSPQVSAQLTELVLNTAQTPQGLIELFAPDMKSEEVIGLREIFFHNLNQKIPKVEARGSTVVLLDGTVLAKFMNNGSVAIGGQILSKSTEKPFDEMIRAFSLRRPKKNFSFLDLFISQAWAERPDDWSLLQITATGVVGALLFPYSLVIPLLALKQEGELAPLNDKVTCDGRFYQISQVARNNIGLGGIVNERVNVDNLVKEKKVDPAWIAQILNDKDKDNCMRGNNAAVLARAIQHEKDLRVAAHRAHKSYSAPQPPPAGFSAN